MDNQPAQRDGAVALAQATSVDLSKHWTPTEDWLATLPKSAILEMVRDAAGKHAAVKLEKLKKDQLPAQALALLPAGWLPKQLRSPSSKKRDAKQLAANDRDDDELEQAA